MKIFAGSIIVSIVALVIAFIYGGPSALILTAILGIMEVSLSFDNAIVNSRILERMNKFWQEIFLTVGIIIAVVGMRFVFPMAVVSISAHMNPIAAIQLALQKGNPHTPGTYGYILTQAHPAIAAFGGTFLLMLALTFFFDDKEYWWLVLPEKLLYKARNLSSAAPLIALIVLLISTSFTHAHQMSVLFSGVCGLLAFLLVESLGDFMSNRSLMSEIEDEIEHEADMKQSVRKVAGAAAMGLFLYLEMIDASFSFDGVIGAFAITSDPIIIMLGLGLIGAMFVRSLTVFFVRKGTLDELVFLDHGAHWAILTLSILLLLTINIEIPEVITGLIGAGIIAASFISSVIYNKKQSKAVSE